MGDGVCKQKRHWKFQTIYFTLTLLDIRTTNTHIVSSTQNTVQVEQLEHSPLNLPHPKWRAIPNPEWVISCQDSITGFGLCVLLAASPWHNISDQGWL